MRSRGDGEWDVLEDRRLEDSLGCDQGHPPAVQGETLGEKLALQHIAMNPDLFLEPVESGDAYGRIGERLAASAHEGIPKTFRGGSSPWS
ncbi:MAG: hypothetical protein ACE5HD_00865 [Acidobacteriota bacterium]